MAEGITNRSHREKRISSPTPTPSCPVDDPNLPPGEREDKTESQFQQTLDPAVLSTSSPPASRDSRRGGLEEPTLASPRGIEGNEGSLEGFQHLPVVNPPPVLFTRCPSPTKDGQNNRGGWGYYNDVDDKEGDNDDDDDAIVECKSLESRTPSEMRLYYNEEFGEDMSGRLLFRGQNTAVVNGNLAVSHSGAKRTETTLDGGHGNSKNSPGNDDEDNNGEGYDKMRLPGSSVQDGSHYITSPSHRTTETQRIPTTVAVEATTSYGRSVDGGTQEPVYTAGSDGEIVGGTEDQRNSSTDVAAGATTDIATGSTTGTATDAETDAAKGAGTIPFEQQAPNLLQPVSAGCGGEGSSTIVNFDSVRTHDTSEGKEKRAPTAPIEVEKASTLHQTQVSDWNEQREDRSITRMEMTESSEGVVSSQTSLEHPGMKTTLTEVTVPEATVGKNWLEEDDVTHTLARRTVQTMTSVIQASPSDIPSASTNSGGVREDVDSCDGGVRVEIPEEFCDPTEHEPERETVAVFTNWETKTAREKTEGDYNSSLLQTTVEVIHPANEGSPEVIERLSPAVAMATIAEMHQKLEVSSIQTGHNDYAFMVPTSSRMNEENRFARKPIRRHKAPPIVSADSLEDADSFEGTDATDSRTQPKTTKIDIDENQVWLLDFLNTSRGKKRKWTEPLYRRREEHRHRVLTQKTIKASGIVLLKNTKRKNVQRLSNFLDNVSYTLALWGKSIREVEGQHGAGVASYFLFLRWIFGFNVALFALLLGFVVLPMALVQENALVASSDTTYNTSYYCSLNYTVVTGSGVTVLLEFIQGTGWLEKTLLFYGYYAVSLDSVYNLPLAYVTTVLACLLLSLGLMARYTGKSFKLALLNANNTNFEYSNKVFGAWDYGLTDADTALLKHKGIHYDLQSDMIEQAFMKKRIERLEHKCSMFKLYVTRLFINFLIVMSLGGAAYLIYFVTDFSTQYASDYADATGVDSWLLLLVQYLPSITITACNAILPLVFELIVAAEDYSQAFVIKITLIRTVFLQLASMIVLIITIYAEITCTPQDDCRTHIPPKCTELKCWETYVGQQFYKLVILDFLVNVGKVLAVELPRRLAFNKCQCGLIQKIGPPEFDIPANVLNLVYGQCIVWLGFLFSPMLPGLVIVKYFIIFYAKKLSAMVACEPSEKPYRASRINTFFMMILLMAYFLCALPVIYSIFGIAPSRSCGSFRVLDYMNQAIKNAINSWPSVLSYTYDLLTSAAITATVIILLCLAVYYLKTMSNAHKENADLLKEQLIMEGRDKQFLLSKLQEIYIPPGKRDAKRSDQRPARADGDSEPAGNINSGRQRPKAGQDGGSFSPTQRCGQLG